MTTTNKEQNLNNLLDSALEIDLRKIVPEIKKESLTDAEVKKILSLITDELEITEEQTLIGIMYLFLKGMASSGTPPSLSLDIKEGKTITKRNVMAAYQYTTGNTYLRRLAETLAIPIGRFAEKNNLKGELAQRINTQLKADKGESLTSQEMAWCSSFSQSIPNLTMYTTDRVDHLLAQDYRKRFELKKVKSQANDDNISKKKKKKKKN